LRIESPVRVDLSVWELLHSVKVAQMVIVEIYFEMAMRSQVSIDLEGRMDDLANVSKPTEVRKATYSQRKCQPSEASRALALKTQHRSLGFAYMAFCRSFLANQVGE
jgi:hypothetical protein